MYVMGSTAPTKASGVIALHESGLDKGIGQARSPGRHRS
jgi:hypothetical protein